MASPAAIGCPPSQLRSLERKREGGLACRRAAEGERERVGVEKKKKGQIVLGGEISQK